MQRESIGVVDYDAGNLKSVQTALKYLGAEFFISKHPEELSRAERIIFPGVGDAGAAMGVLRKSGLDQLLQEVFRAGKPILGICLGSQIILESSEERDTTCLGLVPGRAVRFPVRPGYKIPHMGWNQVNYPLKHPVFRDVPEASSFYFVHSYYPQPADSQVAIGITDYGFEFTSALCYKNIVAMQFHPEKSGERGLRILANFNTWKI